MHRLRFSPQVPARKEATWTEAREPGRLTEATSVSRRGRLHPTAAHRTDPGPA
ncbi:hypothetical protein [Streptomyces sp. NPDC006335]|uniref:hypothetical protein n=1 Tax=Streptomyces sp. NPDC006335 TaxID=3156895 RepID=UPI00339EB2C1